MKNLFSPRAMSGGFRIIAHRGASAFEPENSLPAFEKAGRLGAWAIETDVHKTADGKLVCFHNKKLDGLTDGAGAISETDFQALRELHIAAGNNVDAHKPDELRIPTFEEYLTVCRRYGSVAFIELKTDTAAETLSLVRQMGMEECCVYSSSSLAHLEAVRALSDTVFIHHIFSSEDKIPRLRELGYSGMSFKIAELDDVPAGLVERVHSEGIRICFRASDTPELVRRAAGMGVDYIPSNKVYNI